MATPNGLLQSITRSATHDLQISKRYSWNLVCKFIRELFEIFGLNKQRSRDLLRIPTRSKSSPDAANARGLNAAKGSLYALEKGEGWPTRGREFDLLQSPPERLNARRARLVVAIKSKRASV